VISTIVALLSLAALTRAAVVDHLGLFDNPRIPIGLERLVGIALVATGFVIARPH
jgi:uncharacterized membrane protein YdcZ (DUF606 family)